MRGDGKTAMIRALALGALIFLGLAAGVDAKDELKRLIGEMRSARNAVNRAGAPAQAAEAWLTLQDATERFVMHCYSGDWARAELFLELGGYLSFTGIITFPKSEMMQDVVRRAPADRIMVETDAPFLAPEPYRGKRNEPTYVQHVVAKVAELRGLNVSEQEEITTSNAQTFFRLT